MSTWYACLKDECEKVFETWGEARKHMKACGYMGSHVKNGQTCKGPSIEASRAKGIRIYGHAPDRRAAPKETVTEEGLVEIVSKYFANGPPTYDYRKDVMAKVIRPKYGHFQFHEFGFGTFTEFLQRHGFWIERRSGGSSSSRSTPY